MGVSLPLYLTLAFGSGTADSRHDTPLDGHCPHPYTHEEPTAKVKTLAAITIHETVLITSRRGGTEHCLVCALTPTVPVQYS